MSAGKPAMERLVWICQRLRDGRPLNNSTIAAHFEVSVKTVQRDMDFLRDRLLYQLEYVHERRSWILIKAPDPVL